MQAGHPDHSGNQQSQQPGEDSFHRQFHKSVKRRAARPTVSKITF
jgi:hypothetical protein